MAENTISTFNQGIPFFNIMGPRHAPQNHASLCKGATSYHLHDSNKNGIIDATDKVIVDQTTVQHKTINQTDLSGLIGKSFRDLRAYHNAMQAMKTEHSRNLDGYHLDIYYITTQAEQAARSAAQLFSIPSSAEQLATQAAEHAQYDYCNSDYLTALHPES